MKTDGSSTSNTDSGSKRFEQLSEFLKIERKQMERLVTMRKKQTGTKEDPLRKFANGVETNRDHNKFINQKGNKYNNKCLIHQYTNKFPFLGKTAAEGGLYKIHSAWASHILMQPVHLKKSGVPET